MPNTPALTQRSLLLFKLESAFNTDAAPTAALNAFLVSNGDVRMEPNVLERNFYRNSLSPLAIGIGRKLVTCTFTHEIKGSGSSATPRLGTLLRACGFAETAISNTAGATIQNPIVLSSNTGPAITWTKKTAPTQNFGRYSVRVVKGGASATAKVRVTGNPHEQDDNTILNSEDFSAIVMGRAPGATVTVDQTDPLVPVYTFAGVPATGDTIVISVGGSRFKYVVQNGDDETDIAAAFQALLAASPKYTGVFTSAAVAGVLTVTITGGVVTVTTVSTDIPLGASGGVVNMTWTGSQVLNDQWYIDLLQPGKHYTPISDAFESATIYMYYAGQLHRITGCIGSVSFNCQAGAYGEAQFTFTGQYIDPEDAALPLTPVLEASRPQQVELAQLCIGNDKRVRAQSFSIDMGIQVTPRDSVSHSDGYDGTQYTSRSPTGGVNPEMRFESEEPYWRNMAAANLLRFHARVGTQTNNIVRFQSNTMQLSNINYTDRNNNRVYDMGMRFSQEFGDDEVRISFH